MSETDKVRGPSGVVGTASTSLKMKSLWSREGEGMSLKAFARKLLKAGDEVAVAWFANKVGAQNQERSDANKKAARECATATRTEKRKPKGGKSKTEKTVTAPAK